MLIGPLPEAGKWVRLEVEAARLGLKAGDQVTGFALTQFGGTVFWDKVGVAGRSDPAADPRRSLLAWWKQQTGKDTPGVPPELNQVLKAGPDKQPAAELEKKLRDYYLQNVCLDTKPQLESLAKELAALKQQREEFDKSIPSTFIFRDLGQPRESFVMLRGQYNKPGDKVEPNVPAVLPPLKKADPNRRANRLDLARWLVSPEHPLTARVTVNRFWQQLFGMGLVKTSYDFGSQGELPSHPELLDWLAVSFRESGWNVKELVQADGHFGDVPPGVAGHAGTGPARPGEPAVRPRAAVPPGRRTAPRQRPVRQRADQPADGRPGRESRTSRRTSGSRSASWARTRPTTGRTRGPALYRRSIYVFFKRTAPPPFMANFDAPNREAFCTRRDRSNTPLQALQLMNDVQHFEAARGAGRTAADRRRRDAGRTASPSATALVLARRPAPEEVADRADAAREGTGPIPAEPGSRRQGDPQRRIAAQGRACRNPNSPPTRWWRTCC